MRPWCPDGRSRPGSGCFGPTRVHRRSPIVWGPRCTLNRIAVAKLSSRSAMLEGPSSRCHPRSSGPRFKYEVRHLLMPQVASKRDVNLR
ncbi:hypothetical protein AVEN_118205-1 [Araneus ventricosus]|uniref:Uncharacterized protein n=1 Tax=Araneus ventricosus TaxID=182803 RepID=A0A4Y2I0Y2_ARAVE|nr:hypothetical protein AVEN_118205-1 [Araneus ventricosus]